jgi:medium-chain acyl-[acyl-carrier-protein] hydrolase
MRQAAQALWIARPAADPDAELQLVCLPYAGGSAAEFWSWPTLLPEGVEVLAVQLPGRANRLAEPPFSRMGPLVDALVDAVRPQLHGAFALFGHSMGALIAYELARRLRPAPVRLYLSGHRAPQLPPRDRPVHALRDDQVIDELRRLNGTPDELLGERELRELVLPAVHADFAVAETYEHAAGPRLGVPIIALGGSEDHLVPLKDLEAWAELTDSWCRVQLVPGDHFYLRTGRAALLATLAGDMRQILAGRSEVAAS